MSRSRVLKRIERLNDEAVGGWAGVSAELDGRRSRPAAPGDLLALDLQAAVGGQSPPVEWAILARDPADDRRLLAIAADTHPLLGSADVEVDSGAACGPLSLRCGIEAWLDAEALTPEQRSGVLEAEVLAQVAQKRADLATGVNIGSALAREVDHEAEYRLWLAELVAVRDQLTRQPPASRGELEPEVLPWRPLIGSRRGRYLALAAAVLLFCLGLASGLLWRPSRPAPPEQGALLVNPPFAWLTPQQRLRGPAQTVVVAPAQPFLWLVLDRAGQPPVAEYRLEIQRRGEPEPIWSSAVTSPSSSELSLALPRRLLVDGVYALRLFGPDGGLVESGVYEVEVRTEAGDGQRQSP